MKYTLPIASADTLGGIKVGEDFEIDNSGVLNIKNMDQMQATVDEIVDNVSAGKALVAEAITEKEVETAEDATFQTMHDNILQISGGVKFEVIDDFVDVVEYEVIT